MGPTGSLHGSGVGTPSLGLGPTEICPWVPRAVCPAQGFWLCPCCPLGPLQSFPVPGLTSEG